MAAPLLTKQQKSASVSAKKKTVTRTAIFTPYEYSWPICNEEDVEVVIKHMKSTFTDLKLGRKRVPFSKGKAKKKDDTKLEEPDSANQALRSKLVIGINAVTRGLEKGQIAALVVDRSTNPPVLIKHLIQLCAVRTCPVMCLPKLSEEVGPVLNLHSCIAIGFKEVSKTESEELYDLISRIKSTAEPIDLPFLDKEEMTSQNVTNSELNINQSAKRKHSETANIDLSNKREDSEIKETLVSNVKDITDVIQTALETKSKDYSYLYIMKKDLESEVVIPGEGTKTFNSDDFLSFGSDDQKKPRMETDSEEDEWFELGHGHSLLPSIGTINEDKNTVNLKNNNLKKDKRIKNKKKKQRYIDVNVGRIQSNVNKKKKK